MCLKVEPARGVAAATVNLHLLPSPPASRRRAVLSDSTASLRTIGGSVRMLVGNLNKSLGPQARRLALPSAEHKRARGGVIQTAPARQVHQCGVAGGPHRPSTRWTRYSSSPAPRAKGRSAGRSWG